ncbi:arylamine N-acetyltransferase, partial [Microvirga sp. 3-52]|nr:arylamine N-acetyltransferase [Microvirga sp. 3-52]
LDVIRNRPIYLNLKTIYEKIVYQHRGGYCYEVNGLFHALLCDLGYDAHLVSATVLRQTGKWAKADTHVAILVNLEDEPYLVDVGFGAATPRLPIPLNGDKKTDVTATYSISKFDDGLFDLVYEVDNEKRIL